MTHRLLLDECLSPRLVKSACDAGLDCSCVRDRGWLGLKDPELVRCVMDGDYILVTVNSRDFRGKGFISPGGLYLFEEMHPGLICLNSVQPMTYEIQNYLFGIALEDLASIGDMLNMVLDVSQDASGDATVEFYPIPPAK